MNLAKKKILAAKTFGVGKNRVIFNNESLAEIKEAITKQDIRSLHESGLIMIKPIKGRLKIKKRRRRGLGKIKMKIGKRKERYVKITRKLRAYLKQLKRENEINNLLYYDLRKKMKMKIFKSKAHLKEYLDSVMQTSYKIEEENNLKRVKSEKIKIKRSKK